MRDVFVRLPGVIATLVGGHIMTFLLLATIGASAAWVVVFVTYQARQARRDRLSSERKSKPGSFPGNQH